MLYAMSVLHCLPATTAESDAVANGTVLRAPTVRRWAAEAGFGRVDVLDIENPFWRFYRIGCGDGRAARMPRPNARPRHPRSPGAPSHPEPRRSSPLAVHGSGWRGGSFRSVTVPCLMCRRRSARFATAESCGHDHEREPAVAPEPLEEVHDLVAGLLVEIAGRFVGQQQRRLLHERARDGDPLLLPTR